MKRTFFSLLSIPLFLLSLGVFTACADFADDDGSSALARTDNDLPVLVRQAQCLIGDGAVSTVDIHSGDHVPTASQRKTRSARACETFEVDWSDYRMIRQFGQDVAIIPLTRKSQTAYIELTERGRTKKSVNKVSSRLIVRYDSQNQRPVAVVGTYVYDKNYASRHKNVTDTIGFDFLCKKPLNECKCVTVTTCKVCHKRTDECTCDPNAKFCSACNQKIVNGKCNCCPVCHKYPCKCYDSGSGGGIGGISGGGSSGGGGTVSGGGTSSGGNAGSGNSGGSSVGSVTSASATSASTITSTSKKVVNTIISQYGSTIAACNLGVQTAFKSIYGSSNLPPGMSGRANDMAKAWANNPSHWQPIQMSQAQSYANRGYFVVAGYINPIAGKSGHVVVVVPGEAKYSSSWEGYVPCTMDTGYEKRTSKTTLNYSFGKDKRNQVHFYIYKK